MGVARRVAADDRARGAGRMLWMLVFALAAIQRGLYAASRTHVSEPHAWGLAFLEARDEECKRIAARLCEYIPVYLYLGKNVAVPSLQVAGFAGGTLAEKMTFKRLGN